MFMVDMQNVHQSRTLKPRYARTQATPQAVRLDPEFDSAKSGDIFPGSVLSLKANGIVTLCDGTNAPAGLCGNWIAPVYGIDEIRGNKGTMDVSMWVLGNDAIFEVHAPAFDMDAAWTDAIASLDEGKVVYLKANNKGLLTVAGEGDEAQHVVRFLGMEGTSTILVAGL